MISEQSDQDFDVPSQIAIVEIVIKNRLSRSINGIYYDREDLVQAGLLGLLEARLKWTESRGSWPAFAYRVALNTITDYVRQTSGSRKPFGRVGSFEDLSMSDDDELTKGPELFGFVHHDDTTLESLHACEGYLDGLCGRNRAIARQRYIQGLGLSEIAEYHEVTKQRIYQLLSQTCKRIVKANLLRAGFGCCVEQR